MDRRSVVGDLVERYGFEEAQRRLESMLEAEAAADETPDATVSTTRDAVMRRLGDGPCMEDVSE
ncbi:hypothetical protein [Streptomyces albipurpureus]|uniref:Uncharacterized protein n=1 Tax=Streptomyces albipurpureus TaxID=2897419 RepID=A0ABT0UWI0_9ACTN|nr:hypothetical protein [Streptomyces sp. CWNU-1]MCM2391703.1 hypothetical protein [Streptomyces sp. CWNU-1]